MINFKNIYTVLAGIGLLCISNSSFASPFILKNDSPYDIFYRCRSNAEAAANQNFNCNNNIVKAGEQAELDTKRNYSIKTAGTSSLMKYSSFYDLPHPWYLSQKTLSRQDRDKFDEALRKGKCTPIVSVQAGNIYGWTFKASYTCAQ